MLPGNELSGSQKKLTAGPNEKMEKKHIPTYLEIILNKLLPRLHQLNAQFYIITPGALPSGPAAQRARVCSH